jgi:hypothetical protein
MWINPRHLLLYSFSFLLKPQKNIRPWFFYFSALSSLLPRGPAFLTYLSNQEIIS